MSASVIASIFRQSAIASASRAGLLKLFAIPYHLSFVRLAKRNDSSFPMPVSINARKETAIDQTERHVASFPVVKTIINHRHVWPGDKISANARETPCFTRLTASFAGSNTYLTSGFIYASGV